MYKIRFCLFIFFFLILKFAYSQDQKENILFLNMDSSQFYSEVNFNDYVYKADSLGIMAISKAFKVVLGNVIDLFSSSEFEVSKASLSETNSVRSQNTYRTLPDFNQEEYLGMVPTDSTQSELKALIAAYNASYILSINLYEIFPVEKSVDEFFHIIHYDLFSSDFKVIHSGRFIGRDYALVPADIAWFYSDFIQDMVFRIKAEKMDMDDETAYKKVKEQFLGNTSKKSTGTYIGLLAGFGAPYGGIGLEIAQTVKKFDINGGIGYDYGGLKIGGGMRYYFMESGKYLKYFSGLAMAYNSGGKFVLGAERDDLGSIINPDESSSYKIASDWSLHARLGTAMIFEGEGMLMFTFGYSYPLKRSEPELTDGTFKKSRDNYAKFVSPGGLEFSINLMIFN